MKTEQFPLLKTEARVSGKERNDKSLIDLL